MTKKLIMNDEDGLISPAEKIKSLTRSLSLSKEVLGIKKEISVSAQGLNVAFLFDTTGSMYPYFKLGKDSIKRIIDEIKAKVDKVKFCYIGYKNHGDEKRYFDGKRAFFATGLVEDGAIIKKAMDRIENGGGGSDALTCLEDAFHYVNRNLSWDEEVAKVVVLIGDMPPHGVLDTISKCPFEYNYREEIELFKQKGIKVYSVFCFQEDEMISRRKQKIQEFFREAAQVTLGCYLELADIQNLIDLLVGICMKETDNLDSFILDLKSRKQLTTSKEKLLLRLKGGD